MLSAIGPDMVSVRQRRGGPRTEILEEILEKGDIYFAFRPRIEEDNPEDPTDVQMSPREHLVDPLIKGEWK